MPNRTAAPRTTGSVDPLGDLLVASGGGDAAAFAELFEQMSPRVRALASRVLRDRDMAEEVTQEVFAALWRSAGSYDPGRGSGLGWVMTMTHHRAVDRVRHEQALRRRDKVYGLRAL